MHTVNTPTEAADELVENGSIVNLCPHPVRVPLGWYCWIGDPRDHPPEYEWIYTNAMIANSAGDGEGGAPMQWVDLPAADKPYRMGEMDQPCRWNELSLGAVETEWMPESPTGLVAGLVERRFDLGTVPEKVHGRTYIVSLPVLMGLAAAGIFRADFVAPDSGSTCERDERGQVSGVLGFVRLAPPENPDS